MRHLLPPLFFFALTLPAFAKGPDSASGPRLVTGTKFPNQIEEGTVPVRNSVLIPEEGETLRGFTELLPYALPAPNQEGAGTCYYMSLTGIVEWWYARLNPELPRVSNGPTDISERYVLNTGFESSGDGLVKNWRTDTALTLNRRGGALLNKQYPFTKGWHTTDSRGTVIKAKKGDANARYSSVYNWIDERHRSAAPLTKLPRFRRDVLYADPSGNQWNTGGMPADIVSRIKRALVENKAPVHVIYNHYGYWHATVILGFDDERDNHDCHFVRTFLDHQASFPNDANARRAHRNTLAALERGGGCHPRGVFYVRDSIYEDPDGEVYDFDPTVKGEERPYSRPLVMIEYDWVATMGNHAVQILAD